ncbi:hypothetical protein ACIA5C_20415 [Actinoplanes sp. NPDC051343]|uniref:hypothetical protein n=1 Tax=Actinoplanes sp. NPDC051343 TaxID=3363906 RepID=UPI0037AA7DCB
MTARSQPRPWARCETDENLSTEPAPGTPGTRPAGEDLDLHIGWDRFEKLVLRIAKRTLGLRGIQFRRYGIQGQRQQGIDLAGRKPDGKYVVIQCKDYKSFTPATLRKAVRTFMSGRLPFDAVHFIVTTSASTEQTQLFDELASLSDAYPHLTIDLWGAEQLNQYLRAVADVVAQFWTRETAAVFCTSAPLPGIPTPPPDRRLQAERILVGPLNSEDTPLKLHQADAKRADDPREAANLYAELAARLETAGYHGHGAVIRDRQVTALQAAGDSGGALALTARLIVDALDRAGFEEARRLRHQASRLLENPGDHADAATLRHHRAASLASLAIDYLGDPLCRPDELLAALSEPGTETLPHHGRLVRLLAEGVLASHPSRIAEFDRLLRSALDHLDLPRWHETEIRLRLLVAEYDQHEREALNTLAGRHHVLGRLAALINAREARRCSMESRLEEAVDAWRDAISDAIHDGLADDAADWLYAIRSANGRLGSWSSGIDDEHHLAQALRNTGTDRLLQRSRLPSDHARTALLAGNPIEAILAARQWLTDAVVTGSWAVEMEATRFLGELYRDNAEPALAADFLARSGSAQKLTELAERVGDELIQIEINRAEPWWVTDAKIAFATTQADLIPDQAAAKLLEILTDITIRGRAGEFAEPPGRGSLTERAVEGMCALAHRGTSEQAAAVLDLLAADVVRGPRQFRPSDNAHAAACVEISIAHPDIALPGLRRLLELTRYGVQHAAKLSIDERVIGLIRGNPGNDGPLLPLLPKEERDLLKAQAFEPGAGTSYLSAVLPAALAPEEPSTQRLAKEARDRILSRPKPSPARVESGSTIVPDSYLATTLDESDQAACLEKLLSIAEDSNETAGHRQDALVGAANLLISANARLHAGVFPRVIPFVTGARDGSAYDDQLTGASHPLSRFRIDGPASTLRGHALRLARLSARDDTDLRWIRDQAVNLLSNDENTTTNLASSTLAHLPHEITENLDAGVLAAHENVNIRQLGAILCMRRPRQYDTVCKHLARDKSPRVRQVLADCAVRARDDDPLAAGEILEILKDDVRHSVRTTAQWQRPS